MQHVEVGVYEPVIGREWRAGEETDRQRVVETDQQQNEPQRGVEEGWRKHHERPGHWKVRANGTYEMRHERGVREM